MITPIDLYQEKQSFKLRFENDYLILSSRLTISWKEIVLYPLPFILLMIFLIRIWIPVIILALVILPLYAIFRYVAWYYYTEIWINFKSRELFIKKILFNKIHSTKLITNKLDKDKFTFSENKRGGSCKYVLSYNTHRRHDLIVFKNISEKEIFEKSLMENFDQT